MNETILTLNGKIDRDTAPMYLKPGDVLMRRNARVAVGSGSDGLVNKALQDTLAVSRTLPSGINKTVGWCRDEERNAIIYFNYNSADNHGIYSLDIHSKVNTLVLMTSILSFTADTVVDARVLGDELVWVCPGIEPRILSISRALRFSNIIPVTGVIWNLGPNEGGYPVDPDTGEPVINPWLRGNIAGTVSELSNVSGKGNITGTVRENLVELAPGTDPTHGSIQGVVYEGTGSQIVTGSIIQQN